MKKIHTRSFTTAMKLALLLAFVSPVAVFAAGPSAVNLGSANNFALLAKTGISTTGTTSIIGDIGVSPAAATLITGFALSLSAGSSLATSSLVYGKVYAPGYADPTPAVMTTAVGDMQIAYTDAAGRTNPTATELGAGNIGGMTLAPGLYTWGTGLAIPTDVTLSGGANDVWLFQIAQNLNLSPGAKIILSGGAQANNIFWVVAGQTTIGTTAVFNGNILDQTAIVLNTGAQLNGRAFAQTAVTLDSNAVTIPTLRTVVFTPNPLPAQIITDTTAYNHDSTYTPSFTINQEGCTSGNKFSITSGSPCVSFLPPVSLFGQEIKAIAVNLGSGKTDASVSTLQQFLISQNKGAAARALAVHGATNYFGNLTQGALAEFQTSVGISPALGNFGLITRAYMSAHY